MGSNPKLKTAEDLYAFTTTGEVKGGATWSETNINHSFGTDGYGRASSSLSTSIKEKQRFFICPENDKEYEVNLTDADFAVRPGHHVTAIWCGHQANKVGWVMALHNHDTGRRAVLKQRFAWIRGKTSPALAGWGIGLPAVGAIFAPALAVVAIGAAGWLIAVASRRSRLDAVITAEIERRLGEAIATAPARGATAVTALPLAAAG